MKLVSLDVSGFRAFSDRVQIDLDADVVIVAGANGSGKTSLFDAVLWCLTGSIPRFRAHGSRVVSLYSKTGEATVTLRLRTVSGQLVEIRRSTLAEADPPRDQLRVMVEEVERRDGEAALMELLGRSPLSESATAGFLADALTRSTYLQQDLVREFLVDDADERRFAIVSELVGAGALNEFVERVAAARMSWSRATTSREADLSAAKARVDEITSALSRLTPDGINEAADPESWWHEVASRYPQAVRPADARGPHALDDSLDFLRRLLRREESQLAAMQRVLVSLSAQPVFTTDEREELVRLRPEVTQLQNRLVTLARDLANARARQAEELAAATENQSRAQEVSTLARLALRHLGDRCPVCDQAFDLERTRARLTRLAVGDAIAVDPLPPPVEVQVLRAAEAAELREVSALRERIAELETKQAKLEDWRASLVTSLLNAGLIPSDASLDLSSIEAAVDDRRRAMADLDRFIKRGEQLALAAARAAEARRRNDLERELSVAKTGYERLAEEVSARQRTYNAATSIIDEARDASVEAVATQADWIQRVAGRIFSRIGLHPDLTRVVIRTLGRRHGRIEIAVGSSSAQTEVDPVPVLSTSQLNAFAVALFLGFNLVTAANPLEAVLLDDPVQSLDDLSLLGLVDALRRVRPVRQLLMSTHEPRFARLLARKLRPLITDGTPQRTLVLDFGEWTVRGCTVSMTEIGHARPGMRLAA